MLIDLSRCPKCNGPSDNGHDREVPPNPYYCTKCMAEPTTEDSSAVEPGQEPVADRAAFERHAERLGYSVDPDTREGREGGYWSSHTHLMWETWQAAMAQRSAQPVQETEMRRCPRCWEPMFPPQPTPLTVERLRDALVASRIVPPAAVEDPDGYDDGVTLHRIEALHRRLA